MPTAPAKLDTRYSAAQLVGIGEHISITERNSQEAERESVKIKLLEYFDRQVGAEEKKPMEAVITDLKNHGMFIEVTSCMAFGMIRLSSLKDDLYILSGDGQTLRGRRKHREFRIGDKVQVIIETVDRYKRQMNFTIAEGSPVNQSPEDGPAPALSYRRKKKEKAPNPLIIKKREKGGKRSGPRGGTKDGPKTFRESSKPKGKRSGGPRKRRRS